MLRGSRRTWLEDHSSTSTRSWSLSPSLSLSLSLSSFDVVLVGVVYFCLLVLVVLKETKGLMVAPLIIFHTTMYASPHSRDDRNSPLYQQIGWDLRLTNFCLGYPQNSILHMFTSHAAGIIGMSHHSQQSFTLSAGEWARTLAKHYG
jgi:hypothetical protein